MKRAWIAVAAFVLAAVAIWHPPAAPPAVAPMPAASPPRHSDKRRTAARIASTIVVYVAGAVKRAGLYALRDGDRIDDALRAAGGFAPGADPAGVNLAARASDGDEIDVPLLGEAGMHASRAKLTRGERLVRSPKTIAAVDVNVAGAAALQRVPGLGAALAKRIVDVREHDGPFTSYDQLLDVAGMTQARLDRAQPYLRL